MSVISWLVQRADNGTLNIPRYVTYYIGRKVKSKHFIAVHFSHILPDVIYLFILLSTSSL